MLYYCAIKGHVYKGILGKSFSYNSFVKLNGQNKLLLLKINVFFLSKIDQGKMQNSADKKVFFSALHNMILFEMMLYVPFNKFFHYVGKFPGLNQY